MKIIQAPRASAILYWLLAGQKRKQTWLLPANICPIVPITFMKARVPFKLVDISAATLHMDLEQAETLIRKRDIGGLLYAHTYGDISTPDDFFNWVKSINTELVILDDRCLCIPEFEVSSSADVVLYSTGYGKIAELGFGSYAYIGRDIDYQRISLPFDSDHYPEIEDSYKLAIQKGIQYSYNDSNWLQTDSVLSEWNQYRGEVKSALNITLAHRVAINSIYSSRLPSEIQLQERYQTWRFNIRVLNKKQIMKTIFDNGLFASSHYASLAGIMTDDSAPVAEALANDIINLFNDHYFTLKQAEQVCQIILGNLL